MNLTWALLALVLAPLGLLGGIGLVVLVLKIVAVLQKATEPSTVDQSEYSLEQGQDVGKSNHTSSTHT